MKMIDVFSTWFEGRVVRHPDPLRPFKRTLELERSREVKAAMDLQDALRGLVQAVKERKEHDD